MINISYNNQYYLQQKSQTLTYKLATTKENLQQYNQKDLNKEEIPNASAPIPSKLTMATKRRFNLNQTRNLTLCTLEQDTTIKIGYNYTLNNSIPSEETLVKCKAGYQTPDISFKTQLHQNCIIFTQQNIQMPLFSTHDLNYAPTIEILRIPSKVNLF